MDDAVLVGDDDVAGTGLEQDGEDRGHDQDNRHHRDEALRVRLATVIVVAGGLHEQRHDHSRQDAAEQQVVQRVGHRVRHGVRAADAALAEVLPGLSPKELEALSTTLAKGLELP